MSPVKRQNVKYDSMWFIMEKIPFLGFWYKARKKVCNITIENIKPTKSTLNIFVYKGS